MLLSVFISLLIWHVALFRSYSFITGFHVTLYDFFHNSYIKKIQNYALYTREWTLERKEKEKGKEKEWINKIEWNCQNNYAQDFTSSLSSFFIFLLFIRSSLYTRGHCNPPLFKDGVNKSLSFTLSLFLFSCPFFFPLTKQEKCSNINHPFILIKVTMHHQIPDDLSRLHSMEEQWLMH